MAATGGVLCDCHICNGKEVSCYVFEEHAGYYAHKPLDCMFIDESGMSLRNFCLLVGKLTCLGYYARNSSCPNFIAHTLNFQGQAHQKVRQSPGYALIATASHREDPRETDAAQPFRGLLEPAFKTPARPKKAGGRVQPTKPPQPAYECSACSGAAPLLLACLLSICVSCC